MSLIRTNFFRIDDHNNVSPMLHTVIFTDMDHVAIIGEKESKQRALAIL